MVHDCVGDRGVECGVWTHVRVLRASACVLLFQRNLRQPRAARAALALLTFSSACVLAA